MLQALLLFASLTCPVYALPAYLYIPQLLTHCLPGHHHLRYGLVICNGGYSGCSVNTLK